MPLKQQGHRYLHELFKAVLLYDAPEVKEILGREIGGKLMREWKLERAYQEISPAYEWERYNGNIDVLWVLEGGKMGKRFVLHEVKTGNYDVIEVIKKYRKSHYSASANGGGISPTQTNAPLYIWAWKKHHESIDIPPERVTFRVGKYQRNKDFEPTKLIKRGAVRLLPLEWLCQISEEKIKEFYNEC